MYVAGLMTGISLMPYLLMTFTMKLGKLMKSLSWISWTHRFITSYASNSVSSEKEEQDFKDKETFKSSHLLLRQLHKRVFKDINNLYTMRKNVSTST